ncbi:NAD-dependent epimerase/dehydratase family protein [Candidatus Hepatincolaceae symbiont of Richtersius coronifer]
MEFKYTNAIITGGLGLIGSYVCDLLIEHNIDVSVIDNMYRGKIDYLRYPDKVRIISKDIMDLDNNDIIEDCEICFHIASKVLGIGYSAKNHQDMLFYNDKMTNFFFDYIIKFKKLKELVIISSSCVYDDNLIESLEALGNEGVPEIANLGYGLAKRFLEQKSILWAKENNIKLTIIRPFNIYGERYTWAGTFSQGLPSLVKRVLDKNKILEIWGTGSQRRNYMHAQDCARLIIEIAKTNNISGEIFNLGIKETISLKELAETMCHLYKVTPKLSFKIDMPEGRLIKSASEEKLKLLLPNFKDNLISLEEGLNRMKTWYQNEFK